MASDRPLTPPDRTAVLFVECQRGVVGDLSMLPVLAEACAPALPAMGRLAAGARAAGVAVVHLLYVPVAGGRSTNRRSLLMRATQASAGWTASSPEAQVVEPIGVGLDDIVLTRASGISPVYRTDVFPILRNMGVDEIVVAGVSTNWAIPLVAASASDENFAVTVPPDAVAGTPVEHHESMLRHALGLVARLRPVDDIVAAWTAPPAPSPSPQIP
jgi:nicotinamidase-related amidase